MLKTGYSALAYENESVKGNQMIYMLDFANLVEIKINVHLLFTFTFIYMLFNLAHNVSR